MKTCIQPQSPSVRTRKISRKKDFLWDAIPRKFVHIEGRYITREFNFKVRELCNMACTYCYMYFAKDQSFKDKPVAMSRVYVHHIARRLGEHARLHNLGDIRIVLHGGEPMMAGVEMIRFIVTTVRAAMPRGCFARFSMQTNGTLLTDKSLDVLNELGVVIGISLDGNAEENGQRVYLNGRPTYDRVVRTLRLIHDREKHKPENEQNLARVLSVANLNNSPTSIIDICRDTGVKRLDYLFPLSNHDPVCNAEASCPAQADTSAVFANHTMQPLFSDVTPYVHWLSDGRKVKYSTQIRFSEATPYADWLIRAMWHWAKLLNKDEEFKLEIRLFKQILTLARYKANGWEFPWDRGAEVIGPMVVGAIVFDTDWHYAKLDGRKTIRPGETDMGLSVKKHPLLHAVVRMLEDMVEEKIHEPPRACLPCPLLDICGGGYYLHRWSSAANGYDNPSVFCKDLIKLITFLIDTFWPGLEQKPVVPDNPEVKLVPRGTRSIALGLTK